jgi:hypothetical protein
VAQVVDVRRGRAVVDELPHSLKQPEACMGRSADLGIWFSILLVFIQRVATACALDVPYRARWRSSLRSKAAWHPYGVGPRLRIASRRAKGSIMLAAATWSDPARSSEAVSKGEGSRI